MQHVLTLILFISLLLERTTSFAEPDDTEEKIHSTHVPYFISTSRDFTATIGESVTLSCDVDNLGEFELIWTVEKNKKSELLFNGKLTVVHKPRFSLSGTSLNIQDVRPEDSGTYICQLKASPPVQLSHTLDVQYPPSVEAHPKSAFIVAKVGESITLNCHAKGNPKPIVTWKHTGNYYSSTGEESYTIKNGQKEDSGKYECIADNQIGDPASAVITVDIVAAPNVSTDPENARLEVKEGEPISIACKATGDHTPHITWKGPQHANKIIKKMQNNNKISISKATLSDAGAYICTANNSLGIYTTAVISVFVLRGTPQIPHFTSDPHDTQSTKYTVSWTVNSHIPIDKYSLQFKKWEDNEWHTLSVPASSIENGQEEGMYMQMFQLSELEPSTQYFAVVKAMNKFGWSDSSNFLVFTTKSEENHSEISSSGSCIPNISFSMSMLFLLFSFCIDYYH